MSEETRLRTLVESAIGNAFLFATREEKGVNPLWVYVGNLFDVNSTEALALCREFGFDPHEQIRGYREKKKRTHKDA